MRLIFNPSLFYLFQKAKAEKPPKRGESPEEIGKLLTQIEKAEKAVQVAEIELDSRKEAAKSAAARKADTAKAASEARLALEPVSVYISRATQKLYVRRNTHKPWADGGEVFDATIEVPVTIRNPDKPIAWGVSTYGRLYNWVFLYNGYHAEHHYRPKVHWTKMVGLHRQIAAEQAREGVTVIRRAHFLGFLDPQTWRIETARRPKAAA